MQDTAIHVKEDFKRKMEKLEEKMIFKQEHIDLILLGKKTQTRRPNREEYDQSYADGYSKAIGELTKQMGKAK